MNTLQQYTYDFFLFLCQATGIDIQALIAAQKTDPATFGTYIQQRELFNIFRLYSNGEYDRAVNACADFLKECITNLHLNEFTEKSLKENGQFLIESAMWVAYYDQFKATDRTNWLNQVRSIPLLTPQELTTPEIENSDRRDLFEVEKTMKHINLRRYSGLGDIPTPLQTIAVNNSFVMCDNLTTLLSGLKALSDDYIHITIMLKLDCHLWMSYFIIAIQYKENTWIADDGYFFANPRAKEGIARRGSARVREENLDSSILPYQWVMWADEERKNNRSIINKGTCIKELYIKQITQDWQTRDKVLTYLLFEKLIEKIIVDSPSATVSTFAALATRNSLQLPGNQSELIIAHADLNQEFECSHFHQQCESYLQDLYVPERETLPTVHISTCTMIDQLDGNNTLCSEKQYRELLAWSVKDQERVQLQSGLNSLSVNLESQLAQLVSMVERNLPNIYPYLFSADTVYYNPGAPAYESFGSHPTQQTIYPFTGGQWIYGIKSIGKDTCPCCGNHPSNKKNNFSLNVFHYRQLMWLCGISDRSALPPYYRNYRVHDQIPYHGNTLLDNVNPTYTIKDPCSDKYSNGFGITFYLCGYCLNRLIKQHRQGKETRLHISLGTSHISNVELIK